jgi:prepilin-type N-terminal cleavage/methylation domain-containing protein/prepilin-type processing-associated H-X9-DG protein
MAREGGGAGRGIGALSIPRPGGGFTLIELLVVTACLGILAGLLLPALARSKGRAQSLACLGNIGQLSLAWMMYADDSGDRLPYNLGGDRNLRLPASVLDRNWVNNVMTWDLDPGNTNLAFIDKSPMGTYLSRSTAVFRCPADRVVSREQREAGWTGRVRSYAMNAMVGDAGPNVQNGGNVYNPGYRQFLARSDFRRPADTFVFIDEHPDSVADGYFLNRGEEPKWIHLPASTHNQSAALAFADGHGEIHHWRSPSTYRPPRPDSGPLPFDIPSGDTGDFEWLESRTSYDLPGR